MKKPKISIAQLIGRLGAPTGIRPAGAMADRRTRRNRTRADQKRKALAEE
jgi:hypothetical protein